MHSITQAECYVYLKAHDPQSACLTHATTTRNGRCEVERVAFGPKPLTNKRHGDQRPEHQFNHWNHGNNLQYHANHSSRPYGSEAVVEDVAASSWAFLIMNMAWPVLTPAPTRSSLVCTSSISTVSTPYSRIAALYDDRLIEARKCSIGDVTASGPVSGGGGVTTRGTGVSMATGTGTGIPMGTGMAIGCGIAWRGMAVDAAGAGVGPLGAGPSAMTARQ